MTFLESQLNLKIFTFEAILLLAFLCISYSFAKHKKLLQENKDMYVLHAAAAGRTQGTIKASQV